MNMYLPCQLDKEILKREQVGSEKGELVVLRSSLQARSDVVE